MSAEGVAGRQPLRVVTLAFGNAWTSHADTTANQSVSPRLEAPAHNAGGITCLQGRVYSPMAESTAIQHFHCLVALHTLAYG